MFVISIRSVTIVVVIVILMFSSSSSSSIWSFAASIIPVSVNRALLRRRLETLIELKSLNSSCSSSNL